MLSSVRVNPVRYGRYRRQPGSCRNPLPRVSCENTALGARSKVEDEDCTFEAHGRLPVKRVLCERSGRLLERPTGQAYAAKLRGAAWKARAHRREHVAILPGAPPWRRRFRCKGSRRALRCAWECLECCCCLKRCSQSAFEQQRVGEEFASPTDVAKRLIAPPER